MQLELQGKVAVVTGASHGIGLAVTTALAVEGAHVVAGSRDGSEEARGFRGHRVRPSRSWSTCPQFQARLTSLRWRLPEGRSTF